MTPAPARRPGRPRSERARQAILAATLALAAEQGPTGLHMEAIAKRARVSKETLYRWWHSKTELLLDALADRGQQTIPLPDTGTLGDDLRTFLRSTVDSADATTVRLLHHLAAAAASDQVVAGQVRDRFLVTRRAALGQILRRAAARDEITSDYAALAIDLIYGSMWYRLIFRVGPLDYTWADQVAAAVVAAGRPGRPLRPGRRVTRFRILPGPDRTQG